MDILLFGSADPPNPEEPVNDTGSGQHADEATILIVEDEWLVALEMESALEGAGFRVAGVVATADEAVRMAELHRPDLVLMDIRLRGDRDGIDAASELWRRLGIRSVFVSAHSDPGTRERGEAANPVAWINKPFSSWGLVDGVAAALKTLSGTDPN